VAGTNILLGESALAQEPKLCPNCPMKGWWNEAKQRIRDRQYIQNGDDISPLKICMELRRIIVEQDLEPCPFYPLTETLIPVRRQKHAKQTTLI